MNIVKQDLLRKKQFLKILWSEVWKGGFQMIHILSLMCMLLWCCGSKSKVFFTFIQFSSGYTAHCCVFNNFSMVKQRHQFWDWISISVFKVEITEWPWISPQFTSIIRKLALVFFFDGFWVFWKKNIFSCCQSFVKPWQLCQPPQTKVLIWVKASKMVNFSK